jgi:O-antigen/teichoic acid export membrane protein
MPKKAVMESSLDSPATASTGRLRAHLLRGAGGTFVMKLSATALGVGISILLAHALGTGGYGRYVWGVAWAELLLIPALLGVDRLLPRELAAEQARGAPGRSRGLLSWSTRAVLGSSVGLMVLAGAVLLATAGRLPEGQPGLVAIALPLVPIAALLALWQGALRGLHRPVYGALPGFLLRPGAFAILLALSLLFGTLSPSLAMALQVLAAAGAAICAGLLLLRALPEDVRRAVPESRGRIWLRAAAPFLLIGTLVVLNSRLDILMLGAIRGPGPAGVYSVAARGSELIFFLLVAVNAPLGPVIAQLAVAGDHERIQRVVTRLSRLLTLAAAVLTGLLVGFAGPILGLFGPGFLAGRSALTILCVGQLVNSATGPVGLLLSMTGHERDVAKTVGVTALLNAVLNAVLIPRYGIDGAAMSTAGSLVMHNLALLFLVTRRLGINPTAFRLPGGGAP